jgi:hypothetical protein
VSGLGDKAKSAPGWIGGRLRAAWTWFWGQSAGAKLIQALVLVAIGVGIAVLVAERRDSEGSPAFPADGPAEFLYLDSGRVIAYLAQIDGGTFTSKTLTHKLTESAGGKLGVQGALELTGEIAQEDAISRVVTPTAAANYFELLGNLEGLDGGLERIGLSQFGEQVREMTEGQFVIFETHALRPPVYVNAYLALRQKHTVSTLFPVPEDAKGERRVERLVRHSQNFREAVGKNPRVVFALRPPNKTEIEARKRELEGEEQRRQLIEEERPLFHRLAPAISAAAAVRGSSREKIEKRTLHAEEHVQYLMPLDAKLLTRERSLIKFGGGTFTVVGKVVRIFPAPGNHHAPVYVDSPTAETWAQPLAHAPQALLCRTDPRCTRVLRNDATTSQGRREALERSRQRAMDALVEQTLIPRRGAVILPIAIYK